MFKKITVLITCLLVLGTAYKLIRAETAEPPRYSAKVKVHIVGSDGTATSETYNYITKQLQSLGDVKIVEEGEDFKIEILTLVLAADNVKTSCAYSVVFLRPVHLFDRAELKDKYKVTDTFWRLGTFLTDKSVIIEHHLCYVDSYDAAEKTCKRIVTAFNAMVLKNDRELFDEVNKPLPHTNKPNK